MSPALVVVAAAVTAIVAVVADVARWLPERLGLDPQFVPLRLAQEPSLPDFEPR